jgi:hypothetical protein
MSSNWEKGRASNSVGPGGKFSAALLTFLLFSVLGSLLYSIVKEIPFFWRACATAIPGISNDHLILLTIQSSIAEVGANFPTDFFNPLFPIAGLASCISGLRSGKPSYLVAAVSWVLVYGAAFLTALFFTKPVHMVGVDVLLMVASGVIIVILCCAMARRFW